MASSNLIKQLQERGLIAQVTDEEALAERLAQGPIALYCGFYSYRRQLAFGTSGAFALPETLSAERAQASGSGGWRNRSYRRPEL